VFVGALRNLPLLRQDYGLTKNANEVMVTIEAFKALRDRGSFPADQVLDHFEGSFAFVLFDSSSKTLMVAGNIEGKCSLFWGCTSDGSLAFSDDDEVLKNGCGTSFAPFPAGCIPHLLGLLRVGLVEAQKAAAKAIYAVSRGGLTDHVGSKIFVTERVVPCLWDRLRANCQDKLIGGLLTGALRNSCSNAEGFLQATFEAGGVEILVRLLLSGNPVAQANASYLLANLILASEISSVRVNEIGTVKSLLKLLGPENDVSVRAEAAGALQALSSKLDSAKRSLVDAGGIPVFISAILAPSKEFSCGAPVQALQENAMGALANISGGLCRDEQLKPCLACMAMLTSTELCVMQKQRNCLLDW
jgi:hypothetical protein